MLRVFTLCIIFVVLGVDHSHALDGQTEMYRDEAEQICDGFSTLELVECSKGEAQEWDERLNKAYQILIHSLAPHRVKALRVAQRKLIAYRDTNCEFYGTEEGTIRAVFRADCLARMARERTLEIEGFLRAWKGVDEPALQNNIPVNR